MKNLPQTVMLLILFTANLSALATDTPKKEIQQALQRSININSICQKTSSAQKVRVYFAVDNKGVVNDIITCTDNAILAKEINDQFRKLSFDNLKSGEMNSVDLTFIVY